jgi:OsmC-like protein
MDGHFRVVVSAGSFGSGADDVLHFPHKWTAGGVTVQADFTGAHLLHLAAAGCVLNDIYREAEGSGISVDGVRVTASGGYDPQTWASTGISYSVQVHSPASSGELARLLAEVDAIAEIPRAIRAGAPVQRTDPPEAYTADR